ncbi:MULTISPECIES: hypothetical protein [Haloferax]|uniref:Uncharacterized protein n=2 Tax=Haloferax TaxID=2251 RepID=A0A6G1Z7B9_9EURY|nr:MULTISPECIES: hypothetical protein [Haloferax]KAB1184818.1 hypothetical protein Hfx1149_17295 [Haloferax sp. CBA1149]MRW82450.1 hypothetical protein [Haloferax marinisediminis]
MNKHSDDNVQFGTRSIEDVFAGSESETVTLGRLSEAPQVVATMIPFTQRLEGPFHVYVNYGEQLQYMFHNCNLYFEGGTDPFGDEHGLVTTRIYPAMFLITDKRLVLVYKNGAQRRVISTRYGEINRFKFGIFSGESVKIWTNDYVYKISLSEIGFEKEGKSAQMYIKEKAGSVNESSKFWTEEVNYDDAKKILKNKLYELTNLAKKIDVETVVKYAANGAKLGALRGGYGAVAGFIIGGGYALWRELSKNSGTNARIRINDLDSYKISQSVITWKHAGESIGGKNGGLVGATIGAALEIDRQTTGRVVSTALMEADVEWIAKEIENNTPREVLLQLYSQEILEVTDQVSNLLEDDFFQNLDDRNFTIE